MTAAMPLDDKSIFFALELIDPGFPKTATRVREYVASLQKERDEAVAQTAYIVTMVMGLRQNWKNGGVLVGIDDLNDAVARISDASREFVSQHEAMKKALGLREAVIAAVDADPSLIREISPQPTPFNKL